MGQLPPWLLLELILGIGLAILTDPRVMAKLLDAEPERKPRSRRTSRSYSRRI